MLQFSVKDENDDPIWRTDGGQTTSPFEMLVRQKSIGTFAFVALTLYACQLLFFAILGMGWSWGEEDTSSGVGLATIWAPKVTLGSKYVQLKKGQNLRVRYDATIKLGKLDLWLSRSFKPGMVFSNQESVHETGKGDVLLQAPSDGWYRLVVSPNSPDVFHRPADYKKGDWYKYQQRYELEYSLSWKAEG